MITDFNNIKFNATYHSYTLNSVRLKNVTSLVSSVKRPFDREGIAQKKADEAGVSIDKILDMWDEKGRVSREKGTMVHKHIERILKYDHDPILDFNPSIPETDAFDKFWQRARDKIRPERLEWVIGDSSLGVAGTVDCLMGSEDTGLFHIFDWKTGKFETNNSFGMMLEPFDYLSDCSFNHYSLQLSVYRLILQRNTNLSLGASYLIHLSSDGLYQIHKAIDMTEKAEAWLYALREEKEPV